MTITPRLRGLWNSAYLLLALTALFWAGNAVVGRAAREFVPPVALAFWRWFAAFLLVLIIAWRHLKRDRETLIAHRWIVLLLGLLSVAAFNTLLYTGLQYTTALNAVLLQAAIPPLILLAGFLMFGDRARTAQIVGVLLSLVGVLAIIAQGDLNTLLHRRLNVGDAIVLSAVLLWVLYSVLLRKRPAVHPLSFLAVTFAIGWIAILPLYAAELSAGRRIVSAPESWMALAYVALFPSLVAYACFNRGVELIGSGRAGIFLNLMPVFGSMLAVGFLGERFTLAHAIGMALIAAGIALTSRGRNG